jgi:hypothetical protein
VRSGGHIAWASTAFIPSQTQDNFTWAQEHSIPYVPGVLATGEYSGIRILPQQPADSPRLIAAMAPNDIRWIALDSSQDPVMRRIGAALGIPRHPIDIGYDVDNIDEEVNQFNWFHASRRDGGSGMCETSTTTACIKPLNPRTGWQARILPEQTQIVFLATLDNDPEPFFMHQSNLTGDRLGYPVMDGVLRAYRAVIGDRAPLVNRSMAADGMAVRNQSLWAAARRSRSVTAWVKGATITISGPPGQPVPVTAPAGTRSGPPSGPAFGHAYGTGHSDYVTLGAKPVTLTLPAAPYRQARS